MEFTVADVVLGLGLAVSTYTDLREGKIYNAVTFPLIALGIVIHATQGSVFTALVGLGVAFGIHFALWVLKVERGGDAKLMMGVGALLGWSELCESTLWMFLLLFPVGLTVLAIKGKLRNFWETLKFVGLKSAGYPVEPPSEQTMLPFGPVIAVAVVVARLTDWLLLW